MASAQIVTVLKQGDDPQNVDLNPEQRRRLFGILDDISDDAQGLREQQRLWLLKREQRR